MLNRRRLIGTLSLVIIIPVISIIMYLEWSRTTNIANNDTKCIELSRRIENQLISYNLSLDNFNYHVQDLDAEFDLIGDLAVWYNQLENQQRYIDYELSNLRECPNPQHFRFGNVSRSIIVR